MSFEEVDETSSSQIICFIICKLLDFFGKYNRMSSCILLKRLEFGYLLILNCPLTMVRELSLHCCLKKKKVSDISNWEYFGNTGKIEVK